jgi:protein involved in polysaccharide export with SLBB domain
LKEEFSQYEGFFKNYMIPKKRRYNSVLHKISNKFSKVQNDKDSDLGEISKEKENLEKQLDATNAIIEENNSNLEKMNGELVDLDAEKSRKMIERETKTEDLSRQQAQILLIETTKNESIEILEELNKINSKLQSMKLQYNLAHQEVDFVSKKLKTAEEELKAIDNRNTSLTKEADNLNTLLNAVLNNQDISEFEAVVDTSRMLDYCKLKAGLNTLNFDHGVIQNDHEKVKSISKERDEELLKLSSELSINEEMLQKSKIDIKNAEKEKVNLIDENKKKEEADKLAKETCEANKELKEKLESLKTKLSLKKNALEKKTMRKRFFK